MRVRLVAAGDPAVVRLVRRVDVAVLLAIAAVREPPGARRELALKWLLT